MGKDLILFEKAIWDGLVVKPVYEKKRKEKKDFAFRYELSSEEIENYSLVGVSLESLQKYFDRLYEGKSNRVVVNGLIKSVGQYSLKEGGLNIGDFVVLKNSIEHVLGKYNKEKPFARKSLHSEINKFRENNQMERFGFVQYDFLNKFLDAYFEGLED